MTEREFRKLRRRDFLQLLISQGKEAAALQEELKDTQNLLSENQMSNSRLKNRLDEKDEQIGRLTERLDEKDEQIERLKERLNEKDEQIGHLKRRLDNKDGQIKGMKEEVVRRVAELKVDEGEMETIIRASRRLMEIFEITRATSGRYVTDLQQLEKKGNNGLMLGEQRREWLKSTSRLSHQLTGVFEVSQAAVNRYVENIQAYEERREKAVTLLMQRADTAQLLKEFTPPDEGHSLEDAEYVPEASGQDGGALLPEEMSPGPADTETARQGAEPADAETACEVEGSVNAEISVNAEVPVNTEIPVNAGNPADAETARKDTSPGPGDEEETEFGGESVKAAG